MWGALPRAPGGFRPASLLCHALLPTSSAAPLQPLSRFQNCSGSQGTFQGTFQGTHRSQGVGGVGVVLWCRHSKPNAAPVSGQTASWVAVVLEPSRDPVDIHLDLCLDFDAEAWEVHALSAGCTVTRAGSVRKGQWVASRRLCCGSWGPGQARLASTSQGVGTVHCPARRVMCFPDGGGPGQLGLPRWHLQAGGRSISSSFSVRES